MHHEENPVGIKLLLIYKLDRNKYELVSFQIHLERTQKNRCYTVTGRPQGKFNGPCIIWKTCSLVASDNYSMSEQLKSRSTIFIPLPQDWTIACQSRLSGQRPLRLSCKCQRFYNWRLLTSWQFETCQILMGFGPCLSFNRLYGKSQWKMRYKGNKEYEPKGK